MKVDRRRWETSVGRNRILVSGLVLLLCACAVLGLASRSRHALANAVPGPAVNWAAPSSVVSPTSTIKPSGAAQVEAHSVLAGLPIIFEPNQGQGNLDPADSRAKFVGRGPGYSLFLGSQGAILSLVQRHAPPERSSRTVRSARVNSVEMKLAGANPNASVSGTDLLPGRSNYFIGNDPAKWRTAIPQFARVRYAGIYPGIDLVFYGNQGRLEYDFKVAPGADASRAELEFNGAKAVAVEGGALVIRTAGEDLRLEAPRVYQEMDGLRQPVQASFTMRGPNRAGFSIGNYDRSRELIIDPILTFSTYFGGSGDEHATSVAVDGSFNIYIAGSTNSPNLPAVATFQTALAGPQNVYVAKISPPLGSIVAALDYVTYLGGNGTDTPVGIEVDGRGDAFVAGTTSSTNFPTTATNAYQPVAKSGSTGTTHVFVTELNSGPSPAAATTLPYSTYLSGTGTDAASGMTIDAQGNVYVTGTTSSQDVPSTTDQFPASTLPQMQAFQAFPRSSIQFFVTKVDTQASGTGSILYSTYFGGGVSNTTPPVAIGGGIAADTAGNVYFSGTTNFVYTGASGTTDFPILDAYQPCLDLPPTTTVVNPPTCSVATSTVASDAFVAKLNLNQNVSPGQQLAWSTYLGGTGDDSSTGVALDTGAANVYVVGTTDSPDFVATTSLASIASYQKCLNNNPLTPTSGTVSCGNTATTTTDAWVARVSNPTNKSGTTATNVALGYFTYLGGGNNETGTAITVDSAAGALITGLTQSPYTGAAGTFPVYPNPNSIQGTLNGPQDAFVARLNTGATIGQTSIASWVNYFGGSGTDSGTGIALDVNQNTYIAGETNSTDLFVSKPLPSNATNSGGYDAFVTQLSTALSLSVQGSLALGTNQTYIPAGTPAQFTYIVTNNGPDLAPSGITLQDNLSPAITGVPLTFVSASTSSGSCGGVSSGTVVSCSLAQLQSGSTATVTITLTPTASSSPGQATFNGGTVQVLGQGNIVYAQTSVPATMSDFKMSVGPSNQSIPVAGDTATYQVVLTPLPLYTQGINLSCSGQPPNSSCGFAPPSLTMQGTSGSTSTLSITTTPRPIVTTSASFPRLLYALGLLIPGLVFTLGSRRRRAAGMMILCMLLALVLFLPACSHSNTQTPASGTPAGTYTITVTATSGSDSKSQQIQLTVP